MCTNARELSNCHGIRMLAIIVHARMYARLSIRSRKNLRRIMAPSDTPLPRRINNSDWWLVSWFIALSSIYDHTNPDRILLLSFFFNISILQYFSSTKNLPFFEDVIFATNERKVMIYQMENDQRIFKSVKLQI